ncbi:MAG: AMP-binding protein, partial [Verrucomicrobia bacterium]|nr:AMP-binding protein [Verrucomicrobiota bacterium]
HAGLTAVPLQTDLTAEAFARTVADAGLNDVFVSNRFLNRLRPWAGKLGLTLFPESQEMCRVGGPLPPPAARAAADLASLMFTSGSTGSPKGVMVTHRNIECNSRDIIAYLGLQPDDRVMAVLPFHYCFGLSLLHTHLMAGGSVVLNNEFKLFPESVLVEMQRKECTGFAGVPSTYQILLRNSRFRQMTFPKLRWFQQAGGRLPNACIQELREAFPTVRFFLMYGQTEGTARLSYLPPERLADKPGSIGRGLPTTKLEVLRTDGTPVAPGSDEIGEIVASGGNIAPGYWNDPVETGRFFRNGRLHTGDLARVDSEGFIFIVEREREMIKTGGNRVSAKEVEDVIAELPEVVEAAVVGAPHELLGEAIKALVVPAGDAGLAARDVLAHCHRRLPSFKVPEEVIFVRCLPHNSSGKILKAKLKEMIVRLRTAQFSREDGAAGRHLHVVAQPCLA